MFLMLRPLAILLILLGCCTPASADTIVLRDGTTRKGKILHRTPFDLRLRLDGDGIFATIVIQMDDVERIQTDPVPPLSSPPTSSSPPTTASATTIPPAVSPQSASPTAQAAIAQTPPPAIVPSIPATSRAPDTFATPEFLAQWNTSLREEKQDDPTCLPEAVRDLWDAATLADVQGKRAETLDALHTLEQAVRDLPQGPTRLETISLHVRKEGFGAWMARVHWDIVTAKFQTGQFDLDDVREPERPVLVDLLRDKTKPALEPLRMYFPPVDPTTGVAAAFKPAQLQAINATNALDVMDKAAYAAAVLLGQLKLEPAMPAIDRQLLSSQLVMVNRVLSRARDLQPAAQALVAKQERDRKTADDKARRDAALQLQRGSLPPK